MSNSTRIAKNTIALYFRQILIMLVSLYTVRVVLATLGAEDYGIYNVVAGVVTMFGFLSGAMATASQRYFSFDLGKGDTEHLKTTFSVTFQIYLLIIAVVVLIAETFGLWFVNHKLVISAERMTAANWIYQAAIVSFVLTLVTTPYMASIIAHENMKVYAYVSIVEAVLKLGIVFLLKVLPFDKLSLYGVLLAAVAFINTGIYRLYCHKHFEECHLHFVKDGKLFKEIVGYSGWNLFGSAAGVVKNQILNILLNIYFGTVVNAARGIAFQVNSAVNSFAQNFTTALRPQIIKGYAADEKKHVFELVFQGCKFTFFLMYVLALPLCLEMNTVLSLWLKKIPEYSVLFTRLVIIEAVLTSVSYSLMTLAQATGKIKLYQGLVGGILLLNLPISWGFLKLGFPPYAVMLVAIGVELIAFWARVFIVKHLSGFPIAEFFKRSILPCIVVFILSGIVPFFLFYRIREGIVRFFITILSSVFFVGLCVLLFGMNKKEKMTLLTKLKIITEKRNVNE